MKKFYQKDMKGGWFVGNFKPTAFKTKEVEVCYKIHPRGEKWDSHYHKIATEINLVIKGKLLINDQLFQDGEIFIVNPGEVVVPKFLKKCEIVIVKIPSVPGDKYVTK